MVHHTDGTSGRVGPIHFLPRTTPFQEPHHDTGLAGHGILLRNERPGSN